MTITNSNWWIPILAVVYGLLSVGPAWDQLRSPRGAKDDASYHFAVQAMDKGINPYKTKQLKNTAKRSGFQSKVYPYLYPPPFLVMVGWMSSLTYEQSSLVLFGLNQIALVLSAVILARWLAIPVFWLCLLGVVYTPLTQSAGVGQINGVVLLLISLGLRYSRGVWLALAALIKMSPASLLFVWAVNGKWRAVLEAVVTAVLGFLIALMVCGPEVVSRFLSDILPGLMKGDYNGLKVPLGLPANHSLTNLGHKIWPSDSRYVAADVVKQTISVIQLFGWCGIAVLADRAKTPLAQKSVMGIAIVWMVVTPTYTYEHHLSLLFVPAAVLLAVWRTGQLSRHQVVLGCCGLVMTIWPLSWFRMFGRKWPELAPYIQETKLLGPLIIGLILTELLAFGSEKSS